MNTLFEMAGECRHLSDKEVIYNITNSEVVAQRYEELLIRNEVVEVDTLFEELTPGRKKVALAAVEMYKRIKERGQSKSKVTTSRDIYNVMFPILCDLQHEEFWLIACSQTMNVIRKVRLSSGGIDGTYVDVRLLLKQAILNNAANIIVVHNHPSGNWQPSMQDRQITERVKGAAETVQLKLTDHVIVADGGFFSFADEGMI